MVELKLTATERISIYNFVASQEGLGLDDLARAFDVQKAMKTDDLQDKDLQNTEQTLISLGLGDFDWFFKKFKEFKRFKGESASLVVPLLRELNRAKEAYEASSK